VFASGVCARRCGSTKEHWRNGSRASQAESSGGSAGSAGAPVSRHAGAAGKSGGGGLIEGRNLRNGGTGRKRGNS
jgi:hypothetical protein